MPSNDHRVERLLHLHWNRRARSAILPAPSLARIALLAATDHVSVRLEHELALLREELRIKGPRMERVPPRHADFGPLRPADLPRTAG